MKNGENKKPPRGRWAGMLALGLLAAASLTGCRSGAPADLAGTSWKVTSLTAPDGTTYDEASYDTLIGTTVYTFGEDGVMTCTIGGAEAGEEEYQYTYEKGTVAIRSDELECGGVVKGDRMKLALAGEGEAVLTRTRP